MRNDLPYFKVTSSTYSQANPVANLVSGRPIGMGSSFQVAGSPS